MTTEYLQKYRPQLHFAPKKNWMNDPNGMVFFEGEYHLFFQHNPNDSVWGPMHWGHAVSKDMITWEELDIALYPDELGTIFSGSAVVDWNNTTGFFPKKPGLVAIFTHHLEGAKGEDPKQSQSIAYSHDRGRTWIKYAGNPVLEHDTKVDFRDPKVFWHNETAKWIMVLAVKEEIFIYSSSNLIDWKIESEFGEGIGCHEGVWECPDLFRLKNSTVDKWVLFVSIGDNPLRESGSRTQYFIGEFDGSTFTPDDEEIKWLDYGKDNYAGVSFSDIPKEDGRRIYLGWMSNWRYANDTPTNGWRSQMTLPRELDIIKKGESYRVVQKPVKELEGYFTKTDTLDESIELRNTSKRVNISTSCLGMKMNFQCITANEFGIIIHHTEKEFTTLTFDYGNQLVTLDRSRSGNVNFSQDFSAKQSVEIDNKDNLKLSMVIDASSIELFINDGEYTLTSLIFPEEVCSGLSFFAKDGKVKVEDGCVSILKYE